MKVDETNFIRCIRKGREEGILYVIETYGGYLRTIVRRRLFAVPDLVDDCMNDILFGIWKNIDSYDESKGSFLNWASAVAQLKAIDYLRKACMCGFPGERKRCACLRQRERGCKYGKKYIQTG